MFAADTARGPLPPRSAPSPRAGNLFIIIDIEFPTALNAATQASLAKLLPPPKHTVTAKPGDDDVDELTLS
mgnify:CR=1 FL=1